MSQQLTRQQQGSGNACMQNCRMNLAKSNATLTLYWVALVYDEDEIMETVRIVMSFGFLKLCLHYKTVSWVFFSRIFVYLKIHLMLIWLQVS